jgi:3-phenylpropionate/cinnamic acid dioxygenase small subunit
MKIEFSDWLQIQETLARYNRHLDDRDWNAFGDVFTEDAGASY